MEENIFSLKQLEEVISPDQAICSACNTSLFNLNNANKNDLVAISEYSNPEELI